MSYKLYFGIIWPASVPLEAASSSHDWQSLPATQSVWCYDASGVSRSLWLTGHALEDGCLRQVVVEAIEAVFLRPTVKRSIPSSHICHDVANPLQICLRFAHECEHTLVKEQLPLLVEQILDAFDPAFALGFRDLKQDGPVDQPAWLTGAPSIVMVLLAASMPIVPAWDRIVVIA